MIVTYNKKGILSLNNELVLKGGANIVESKDFTKWVDHPTIKTLVEDGALEFTMPANVKTAVESDLNEKHLLGLKPKEALELVPNTIDEKLLNAWLKVETRKTVKAALEAQLKALAEPAKLRTDADSGDNTPDMTGLDPSSATEELAPLDGKD